MTFVQEKGKPASDTTLFVSMATAGFNMGQSEKHNYHIHMRPVNVDVSSATSVCQSTSGHWNPYDANINGKNICVLSLKARLLSCKSNGFSRFYSVVFSDTAVYSKACSASNLLGCEVGDTSAKFGPIDLAGDNKMNQYFLTDINTALSGAYSIIGRSVTIHGPSQVAPRYACADITQKVHR